ncbi:hydrogenase maturation nickel metallochaperone HypA [Bdellovibrionota bacterium FG-1]
MHEVAIAQNIVEICENHAGTSAVACVQLEIGALSGVMPEALEFCFEACTQGTKLEGATLLIDRIQGQGKCPACDTSFQVSAIFDPCPHCGAFPIEVLSGKQMRVLEIQLRST